MALFPNVPQLPGVPPLLRAPGLSFASGFELLVADAVAAILGSSEPQWGIFLDGEAVLPSDCTVSFEYKRDAVVADYPIEGGGFESYDKVELPFDVRVSVATGGSVSKRQALIDAVDDAYHTLELYDVLTPEKIFQSCNISHWDQRRRARDVGLLVVDVWLVEVRVNAGSTFSDTQQPSGADPVAAGNVQPVQPGSGSVNVKSLSTGDETGF